MFPKIKDSISVLYRRRNSLYEVNFLFNSSSVIVPFELNRTAFKCLRYLTGQNSIERIAVETGLEQKEVNKLVNSLRKARVLHTTQRKKMAFKKSRFITQLNFFSEFEANTLSREKMQKKLETSHVAIIGLGGIGSWVAQGLALAGVGEFTLIDPDLVELTNLNRQCLYTLSDIGQPKAEVLASKFFQINQAIRCRVLQSKILNTRDCKGAIKNVDLVINCADEPNTDAINRIVTDSCYPLNTPHILCGGYDGHLSFVGPTIIPGRTACWYCYKKTLNKQLKVAKYKHLLVTPSHFQGGNIAAISAITANYHTLEAIKVLSGFATPTMLNKIAELDFLNFGINFRNFKKQINCNLCGHKKKGTKNEHR